ncbi:MAG: T9SS type A sorting domain-containing protein [Chitinophagaceae bacterium]|nr:T9SS type A sorting domain-containing protein [Chitinophagaceae bacterium]MBP6478234.1 T9SS type A sorting domain-containing protein [Chitinophagaceae bacterium]HQV55417.1 T9SS type A sorting domain-containing protein [Chitinophagaceae bacterium]HQX96005.1 T9SS type A sorting domain-containing protein [Chitinophagaceae bacterium]HQZ50379.1 T9SS type A sorting domain-containing protein [Chitinophagaceae bacterium]
MKKIYSTLSAIVMYCAAFAQPTQPNAPLTCNGGNCTQPTSETCIGNSTVVTSFTGATLRSGSPTSLPALYTFYNIATISGNQINATVTIDQVSNVSMTGGNFSIDDDGAVDQNNNSITSFFAPRITPAASLASTSIRGYVQFTIRFYVGDGVGGQQYPSDYTTIPPSGGLTGLNYIHYDIDGSTVGTGGWFRETGVVRNVSGLSINGDVSTELASYTYPDGGDTYKGFAGSVCERTGVSRCAQVAAAASYATPQTSITVRMGYDYNRTNSNMGQQPTRQYGSRFGCFSFPQQSTLPVYLKSFGADRYQRSTTVNLKWTTSTEINNVGFEIQANKGHDNWVTIGYVASAAVDGNSSSELDYTFSDNNNEKSITQYRLRQIDKDAKFKFSDIRSVRGLEQKGGIIIYPNPSTDGRINVVFDEGNAVRDISVQDMSGRVVKKISGVTNSNIQIENLTPGMYTIRVFERTTGAQTVQKIVVNKR